MKEYERQQSADEDESEIGRREQAVGIGGAPPQRRHNVEGEEDRVKTLLMTCDRFFYRISVDQNSKLSESVLRYMLQCQYSDNGNKRD